MKLRWYTEKDKITAQDVRDYVDNYEIDGHNYYRPSLQEAKRDLEREVGPTLQYFDEETKEWVDTPSIIGYR